MIRKGARQVGKTYLVEGLAKPLGIDIVIKSDFKADESLNAIFSKIKDPKKSSRD